MTDNAHSSAGAMSWWIGDGEGPPVSLPSWIAPRPVPAEFLVRPSIAPSAPPFLSSAPPPNIRLIASLRPPSNPQIAVQDDPAYPDLREENAALRRQLAQLALSMARLQRDVLEASESELVKLACAVAERVTRSELLTTPSLVVAWAREAIDAFGAKQEMVVAIAPDLAAILDANVWKSVGSGSVVVETDPSLSSFQCEVRARSFTVDASGDGRVAAIARELGASNE